MTKKAPLPRKSALHFERIPMAEVMKKISPDGVSDGPKGGSDRGTVKPPPRPRGGSGHFHGVQFYNDPDALCRIVGSFVGEGLERGSLALLIATPDHSARIDDCLRARGIDVDDLRRQGSLVTLDAYETLQRVMADGMPSPGAFKHAVGSALTHVRRGREQHTVHAYGEMVDLLWKDGLEAAAIRLETLWNQLGTTEDFKLVCGYSMGNFYKGAAIENIHAQHSHLIAGDGDTTALPDLRVESATPS